MRATGHTSYCWNSRPLTLFQLSHICHKTRCKPTMGPAVTAVVVIGCDLLSDRLPLYTPHINLAHPVYMRRQSGSVSGM